MKKTVIILMIITFGSKFFGLARDITLSYFYGTSSVSDAYLISQTIPLVVFSLVGAGIATAYIPIFSRITNEEGHEKANKFTNNLINLVLLISLVISIFVLVFTESVVKLFASGFNEETLILAVNFTRISIFGIFFIGLGYILKGYLQLKKSFIAPAMTGFALNFIIVSSIILSSQYNIFILAIGSVIAVLVELLCLAPLIYKKGFRYSFKIDFKDKNIKKMLIISLPVILGTSVNQINKIVDRNFASEVVIGGISALDYANRLNLFIQGIFVVSFATVMYPLISKMAIDKDMKGLKSTLTEVIGVLNIILIPITIGSMIFAKPIVELLYGRGQFDDTAVTLTSTALFYYSIGIIGYGYRQILTKVFYAFEDTKTPMINAAVAVLLNIVLIIVLSRYLGLGGIALATSISAIFTSALLIVSLRRKIGALGLKVIVFSSIKIFLASVVMGVMAKVIHNVCLIYFNNSSALIVSVIFSGILYLLMIYLLKIDELDVLLKIISKKMKKNKSTKG